VATHQLTDEEMAEFVRRMRAARTYAGMTVDAMAQALGVSGPTVKRWEAGRPGERNRSRVKVEDMARRIGEITGAPWPLLGRAQERPDVSARVEELAGQLADLRQLVLGSDEQNLREAVQAAADAERQYGSTSRRSAEPSSEAVNG
jgi:transcriptional regulator with XRE-family HTH domain